MPELPEVETVRRGLEPLLTSRVVLRADVRRPDLRRLMPPNLAERLTGARVLGLRRRSKYLLADLAGGDTMLLHLGMSGRILVSGAPIGAFHHDLATPGKHDHLVLDLEGGARVAFNDARRFGSIDLCPTAGVEAHPLLSGLGPEPLGNDFDGPSLAARLAGRATPLKAALLDQRLVAGLGNIYVCEALWRAGLSPLRLARDVAPVEAEALAAAIRAVLIEAIEAGGSSLRDHRRPDGELGYFQHAFAVYGREDEACRTPGCAGVVARTVQAGRSSFHCPSCQRAPGPRG